MSAPDDTLARIEIAAPPLTYAGPRASRDSTELWSEVRALLPAAGGAVLDLGCGSRDQAPCAEHLGFRYVGVDYSGTAADLVADAHALPFPDATFDCVFSYAVLEHLHTPAVALAEICRVLRPGGVYVGTVSQGEPFHASYFHMTPWGLVALLRSQPSMRLRRMWAGPDTLRSLADMGRYPRLVRALIGALDRLVKRAPWLAPRKARWPLRERQLDALYRAGSLCFSVVKDA
jgi:SAM-dependent methyltransferase